MPEQPPQASDAQREEALLELETVGLTRRGPVAVLTLNRPRVRNAVNGQMRADLRSALAHVVEDRSLRGLVVTGAGPGFCAGGDIRGMQERLEQGSAVGEIGWRRQRELHEILHTLYELDRPTIAAVNGAAAGLGLDLALTCDFVWLADTASVAATFIKRGLVPDGGGMFHLPRRVGVARAKELIFSGRAVAADEALSIGLADAVRPAAQLIEACVAELERLAQLPATAQGLAKSILNRSMELSLDQVFVFGSQAQSMCYATTDHQESVRDFLEARRRRREGA